MIPVDQLAIFFLASVALALAPGPDNIFVLSQSALNGYRGGLAVTLGLCTGLIFHTTLVALGVAAILKASVLAFSILKIIGAAYLLYLAWGAWHAAKNAVLQQSSSLNLPQLYRRGIFMNISNPKVSIFFLAFLPQFANPDHGSVSTQIMLLGGLFMLVTLLIFGSIALLAGRLSQWLLNSERAQARLNHLASIVFAGLALKLLFTDLNT